MAAAAKGPSAGHAVSAGHGVGLALRARAPSQDGRLVVEPFPRNVGSEVGRGQRTARALAHDPTGAGVGTGDDLERHGMRLEIDLVATEGARQHQPKELRLVHCRQHILGHLALGLNARRRRFQKLSDTLCAGQHVPALFQIYHDCSHMLRSPLR